MRALWVALALAAGAPGGAAAECRQALALGLDVSGSVDQAEYRMQIEGLAGALMRPDVQAAFLAVPGAPVHLFVYEWAGSGHWRLLVDWTEIADAAVLAAVAARLTGTRRMPQDPGTALGEALLLGAGALAQQADCWRRTLDLSGDGQSNSGPRPRDVRADPRLGDVTVNGLVVAAPAPGARHRPDTGIPALVDYFRIEVIRGPGAFVEVAEGYADYEEAMARKLLRELETPAIGALSPPIQPALQ